MSQRPNLILGLCAGYTGRAAEVFVRSARRNAPSAAMHMFTKDVSPDLLDLLRDHDITSTDCGIAIDMGAELGFNIYSARHFVLRHFLRRNPQYGKVLLSDVRDVVVQHDPFALPLPGDVLFAAESKSIRDSATNASWIRKSYGPDVLAILERNPVTCAGTVLGRYTGILRYLDLMCEQVKKHPDQETDQGLHNYIAWGLAPVGMAVDLTDSVVSTLDGMPADRVAFKDGHILIDGKAKALVHQWDRQDELRGPVMRTWQGG